MLHVLTSGVYSDYRLDAILEGEGNLKDLAEEFNNKFLGKAPPELPKPPEDLYAFEGRPSLQEVHEYEIAVKEASDAIDAVEKATQQRLIEAGLAEENDYFDFNSYGDYFIDWLKKEKGFKEPLEISYTHTGDYNNDLIHYVEEGE